MLTRLWQHFATIGLCGGYPNIVWGTGGPPPPETWSLKVGIDPGSIPIGNAVTGYVKRNPIKSSPQTVAMTYGPRCSGPASVTILGFGSQVSFTVSTSAGTGDATLTADGYASLEGHVSGDNIVWGT